MKIQNNKFRSNEKEKILYIKGGNAIEEGTRLVPLNGTILKGGPDQFFLAVLSLMRKDDSLRLVTFGKENKSKTVGNVELVEYALRKNTQSKLTKSYYFATEIIRFIVSSWIYNSKVILCGLDGPTGLAALLCAKLCGARFIFSVHNALNLPQVSNLYRKSNKLLVRYSDRIIVHGEFLADQVLSYGVDKSKLAEYASTIDDDELRLINDLKKQDFSNQINKKIILFVGRLEEDKGVYDLLQAFNLAKLDSVELVYIGDGGALEDIKNKVSQSNILNVRFLGHIPYSQVYQHLCSASVLVTPTQTRFPEGRCKSIVEAFIAGVPVIAPDYGPFPYLVKNKVNGLMYEPDSVVGLSQAIVNIIKTPDLLCTLKVGAAKSGQSLLNSSSYSDALLNALAIESL